MCHFTDKPGKSVIILSSLHHTPEIENNGKPEMVNYYNQTKSGVDTLDQLVRFYSVKRKSLRWPVTIFYNLLDIIAYNSFVIYSMKYPEKLQNNKWRARKNFLIDLSKEILSEIKPCTENNQRHYQDSPIPKRSRLRCTVCPRDKDIKTYSKCAKCVKAMCKTHMENVCADCL